MNTISTKLLTANKAQRLLIGEFSDFSGPRNANPFRVNKQNGAVLCTLKSHTTGMTSEWFLSKEIREDGELLVSIFKPTAETLVEKPHLAPWEFHIIND